MPETFYKKNEQKFKVDPVSAKAFVTANLIFTTLKKASTFYRAINHEIWL